MHTFYREVLPGKGFLWGLLFDKMGLVLWGEHSCSTEKGENYNCSECFLYKKKACKKVFGPWTK